MVKTGLDVLFEHKRKTLAGRKIGLVANPSSVDSKLNFIVDLFRHEKSWQLVKLFGPEHGLHAEVQDQVWSEFFTDSRTGLPVYSLYGKHLKPTPQMLEGLDTIVFDIQDVGSRYYTFIYTLSYVMEACANENIEVVVLDRPNPINGILVEGPVLEKGFESFVGRFPIPIRHGMTVGELALYFQREFGISCRLEIVLSEGWLRNYHFEETGLPWVLPSPNMPTVDTAIVYPGMCLFEGTNVSEGRGTTRPFEIFGAPWIDPYDLCEALESHRLDGVIFRPTYFQPTFNKYQGQLCAGAQIHVLDRLTYRPVKMSLCVLSVLLKKYRNKFEWKNPPYEYETVKLPIDILFGNSGIREALESGETPDLIESRWQEGLSAFQKIREKYLMYS